jgi:hypothetical protein
MQACRSTRAGVVGCGHSPAKPQVAAPAKRTSRKNSLLFASCTTAAVRPAALLPLPLVYTQMGATCVQQQQQQQQVTAGDSVQVTGQRQAVS